MINQQLIDTWLKRVEDPQKYGIPELNFLFWEVADEQVKQAYLEEFRNDPALKQFIEERYYPPEYDFDSLANLPENSLGYAYYHHLIDNGLSPKLASNYRTFQENQDAAGMLKGMPEEMKYSLIRGFQMHDIWHPLTGYDTTPLGEVALQAFTLAQKCNPYPAFWMSVLTTRSTLLAPQMIRPYMDAISDGWQLGRRAKSLMPVHWEELFDRPLVELRQEYKLV